MLICIGDRIRDSLIKGKRKIGKKDFKNLKQYERNIR